MELPMGDLAHVLDMVHVPRPKESLRGHERFCHIVPKSRDEHEKGPVSDFALMELMGQAPTRLAISLRQLEEIETYI